MRLFYLACCASSSLLDVLTTGRHTVTEHTAAFKQYISSMRGCPLVIGCMQVEEGGAACRRRWGVGRREGGDGGRWAGEHRTAAVASEAEIGFLLSSARQSPPLSRQSK